MKAELKKKLMFLLLTVGCVGSVFCTVPSRTGGMSSQRKVAKRCAIAQNENVRIWDNLRKYSFDYNGLKVEVQKLKGLEKEFVDVPVVGVSEVAQDGSIVVKLGHPGKDWNYSNPFWHPWMRVRFEKGAAELADLDMWDRLTSVKVRFTGMVQELGVDCVGITYAIPPPNDPLAGGNAGTITGDELAKLISKDGLGRRQYAVLQRQLAGRRLSFCSSYIESVRSEQPGRSWSCEILARFPHTGFKPVDGISCCLEKRRFPLYALVRCAHAGINERLSYVQSDPGLHVVEMSTTVADPASVKKSLQQAEHPVLVFEDPEICLNHEPEQCTKLNLETVTGDELSDYFANRDEPIPERIVRELSSALAGRELSFKTLLTLNASPASLDWRETIFCRTVNPSQCGLPIAIVVSLDSLDVLPHDPLEGDTLVKVSGRVSRHTYHPWGIHHRSWLTMENVSIETLQGKFDGLLDLAKDASGDDAIAALEKLPEDIRMASLLRFCRTQKDRRVTFSKGRIGPYIKRSKDGAVNFSLDFGKGFKNRRSDLNSTFYVHVPSGVQSMRALDIIEGEMIGPVSARLTLAQPRDPIRRNDALGPELVDFSFDFPKIERRQLPAFDEKTITGDELLKMLDAHKDKLTMLQRLELIARLHGRRLTFTCHVGCVEGSAKGAAKLQSWVAAGVRLRFDMNPPVQFSEVNKVRRITGTADIRNLEGCLNLGALSFHDAVLED